MRGICCVFVPLLYHRERVYDSHVELSGAYIARLLFFVFLLRSWFFFSWSSRRNHLL